jgi:manganese transport protein
MYKTILVTLDATPTDRAIIKHIKALASVMKSQVVLLHMADGWAVRMFGADAVSPRITEDTAYLKEIQLDFQSAGISADALLAYGDPVKEIIRWVHKRQCDLVAMSVQGYRFPADVFLGAMASRVHVRSF